MTRGHMPCVLCGQTGHCSASCQSDFAKHCRIGATRESLEAVYLAALGVLKGWAARGEVYTEAFGDLARALEDTNPAAYRDVFREGAQTHE